MKTTLTSFLLAIGNIRSHFFHTLLSVLGIVIGVAALVSILSLIDGMEKFAHDQIAATTSLNGIMISSEQTRLINNVRIRKDTVRFANYSDYQNLRAAISRPARTFIRTGFGREIRISNQKLIGASLLYTDSTLQPYASVLEGRTFTAQDMVGKEKVMVVNKAFMRSVHPEMDSTQLLGKAFVIDSIEYTVVGLVKEISSVPQCYLPFTLATQEILSANPSTVLVEAGVVTDVKPLKEEIRKWLERQYPQFHTEFSVQSNEFRVEQAAQGFLLFRIIMGLIVGISVLVGGIGVMNVLLISVTERTSEIGIRKAVGATRRDIILQFLSESVTVSAFGSLMGLVLGVLGTMIIIPIVKAITRIPFQAEYTLNTLMVISIVALAIGIIFGTYPAMRAARLDPVEAIRRKE